jgi:dUTP pyrophosphatase
VENQNVLKFFRLNSKASLPVRGSTHSAGLDLCSVENRILGAGERAAISTGLAVAIPNGFYGRVAPRSGLAIKHGVDVLAGVVDSDYRGEIRCALINHGSEPFEIIKGMRIAQLIIEAIAMPVPEWDTELDATERGEGGFGSTGD